MELQRRDGKTPQSHMEDSRAEGMGAVGEVGMVTSKVQTRGYIRNGTDKEEEKTGDQIAADAEAEADRGA